MAVYIAADEPLPLILWNEAAPAFHIRELTWVEEGVRKQFSKPYVYYAGVHEGCGCGFNGYGGYLLVDEEDEKEVAAAQESARRLSEYLKDATQAAGQVQLFTCWMGEEDGATSSRTILDPEQINEDTFHDTHYLEKSQLFIVGS